MKKILTVLLVLAVMTAGVFAVDMPDAAGLKLSFLKNNTEDYKMGWYSTAEKAAAVGESDNPDGALNDDNGVSTPVAAYLGAKSSYSTTGVTLRVTLPVMTNASHPLDTTTIGYTTDISNETKSKAIIKSSSLPNSTTAAVFATLPADVKAVNIGVIKFAFTADADDIEAATDGDKYEGTVTVTMATV